MSFLSPAAFLLALLLPVIVALYLLKLRRTERLISSVYLWQRMVRDIEANTPWQRLRRNLLLILQLLFLVALIFTLARPFTWQEGFSGQAAILIIDVSASMAAIDVSPTRLEAAKDQARRLVDDLPESVRLTVIAAGAKAQVLISTSLDRRQAHQAISSLQVGAAGSDLGVALQLASAIAARQPDTEIIVLSDGGVELPERLSLRGKLRYLPIGLGGENQAISLISLSPAPGGKSVTAFVQIANYGELLASRRLALYANGQLHKVYDLQIPAGEVQAVLAEDLPPITRQVEARLLEESPTAESLPNSGNQEQPDNLPTDDRAFAVLRQGQPAKVALVTEGNLFLETAFSLLPGVELVRADLGSLFESFVGFDVVVYNGYANITQTLPSANLLFVGPTQDTAYFTITGALDNPIPQPAKPDHPLLENITPEVIRNIHILDAARIPLPQWAQAVIVAAQPASQPDSGPSQTLASESPLLFIGETDDRKIAVLTFDLHHSDLPLQVTFPILIANLMDWLAPHSASDIPLQVNPGAVITFSIPTNQAGEKSTTVTITRPDKTSIQLESSTGHITYADTQQLGIYQVYWDETPGDETPGVATPGIAPVEFAVNLLSPQESATAPKEILASGGLPENLETTDLHKAQREWWRTLALLALLLLTIEWLVYKRPVLAYLFQRSRQLFQRREAS